MNRTVIKLISLILLIAMLLPYIIACSKDATPSDENNKDNNGEEDEMQDESKEAIDVKLSSTLEKVIVDPESAVFNDSQKVISCENIQEIPVMKWNVYEKNTSVSFAEPIKNFVDYYYLEFSVYCEKPTDATVKIQPKEARAGRSIVLDFTGWMKYKIRTEEFQTYFPCPDITGISFTFDTGTKESLVVYISEIKLTKPIYELVVPDDIDVNDATIYDKLIANYRNRLVGDLCVSDSAEYTKKVNSIEGGKGNCWKSFKNTYKDDAEAGVVFGIPMGNDQVVKLGTNIKQYYQNIRDMAEGYACVKGKNYKDPELLADILKGLEYGYKYYYGEEVLQGINYGDWYPWQISIPGEIITTLACIHMDIDQALVDKYLAPYTALITHPRGAASNMVTMAKNVILSAALRRDAYMLAEALHLIQNEYQYVDLLELDAREIRDGGFYSDGTFMQHRGIPYTYAYGTGMLSSLANIGIITVGTAFEKQNDVTENQYEFIFNSFLPTIYGINCMNSLSGRCVDQHSMERDAIKTLFSTAVLIRSYAPERWRAKYDSLVKFLIIQIETYSQDSWINSVPICSLDCLDLVNDDSVIPLEIKNQAIVFYNMDRIVQHTENYGVALALSSTRIYKYEAINDANELGWYHGDGMIYIYTDGYDYGYQFFGYANPYLMPGTTVNLAPRKEQTISSMKNSSDFAGGTSQGVYAASGFVLGYDEKAYLSGTFTNESATKISAKKSYFYFDNEIVCLGSSIYDESGYNVITTVENRLWSLNWTKEGHQNDKGILYVGGQQITPDIEYSPKTDTCELPDLSVMTSLDARTMWFGNMGGYVFLGNEQVYYRVVENNSNAKGSETEQTDTQEFLEIVIDHGKGDGEIENDRYAYVYLPEATVEETENYNKNPDVVILARKSNKHAVIEKSLGVIGCVFFAPDTVENSYTDASAVTKISAKDGCAVIVGKNADGSYTISVSDPTQLDNGLSLEISITGVTQVVCADNGVNAKIENDTVKLDINTYASSGATYNVTVK